MYFKFHDIIFTIHLCNIIVRHFGVGGIIINNNFELSKKVLTNIVKG